VIARGSILVVKFAMPRRKATVDFRSREQDLATLRERQSDSITSQPTCTDLFDRHILNAARNLVMLDEKQVNAVAARIELDLRIGYAFTRFLSNNLKSMGEPLASLVISYGRPQP
jgi:DNA topoisomerase IA